MPTEIEKLFYHPVCNEKEIERIFNVSNASDYLLKLRADTIIDDMRLFRVYRNYALMNEENWSLEASFKKKHYIDYLNKLTTDQKNICENISYGNIFSTECNGEIFTSEFGPIITISDSLRFFIKFMNLGLMDFGNRVPAHVAFNSIKIAIRVMLQTETLDFLMDPRGIIPFDIVEAMHTTIPFQMEFITGHEYAHYILGHLPSSTLIEKPILRAIFTNQNDYGFEKYYNHSKKNEFTADIKSIEFGNYQQEERQKIFESTLLWFASLDIYETIADYISPPIDPYNSSHPSARDRYINILENIPMPSNYNSSKWRDFLKVIDYYKELFVEDVGFNFEDYEMYGSWYLDKPNTEWRGKKLIDRVDYY